MIGGLLGATFGWACSPEPEPEPRSCTPEVVGEADDWQPPVLPADVAACAPAPAEPVALCIERELAQPDEPDIALDRTGVVTDAGMGKPPGDCIGLDVVGRLLDDDGTLVPAPEDVRWIELDVDGESWLIALAAPGNTATPAVGDEVSLSIDRKVQSFNLHTRVELRDQAGQTLWWMAADDGSEPLEYTPQCLPVRLGAPQCQTAGACWQAQHHALEIEGVSVAPGTQAVIDGLRFTHGASAIHYDDTCTDVSFGWRMLAATREG